MLHFFNGQIQSVNGAPEGYYSSPADWKGPTAQYVYYSGWVNEASGKGDNMRAFTLKNGVLRTAPASKTPTVFMLGSTPVVTANGDTSGIVWSLERQESLDVMPGNMPAVLHAYDATHLATELYNSSMAGTRDTAGPSVKFQLPTVVNGKAYVAIQAELDVYGLCPCPQ